MATESGSRPPESGATEQALAILGRGAGQAELFLVLVSILRRLDAIERHLGIDGSA
jgi:hypothetical protein